jgi:hypothetical protein
MTTRGIIPHRNLVTAKRALVAAIRNSPPGNLVFLVGPSGASKSEIRYSVMQELVGSPLFWGLGRLPAIAVRATLTDRNCFNSKDLAARMALSLREPDLTWLTPRGGVTGPDVSHIQEEIRLISQDWKDLRLSQAEHSLRRAFGSSAPARGVKWVFLEDAACLCRIRGKETPQNFMISFMQLAEETSVVLILSGTPKCVELWNCYSEVRRRALWVWVHRYREHDKEDHVPFARMAKGVGRRYPLASENLLTSNLDLALINSAGIYGELDQFVRRADLIRCTEGRHSIELRDLERATYRKEQLSILWAEAREFDALVKDNREPRDQSLMNIRWGSKHSTTGAKA